MTISSLAAQTSIAAFAAAQANPVSSAPAMPLPGDDDGGNDSIMGSGLSGSTTASLDSQTMGALLGLTQEGDPAQGLQGQPGTAGAHHRHHHHGGQAQQPETANGPATASAAGTGADPSIAESGTADETQDLPAGALTAPG